MKDQSSGHEYIISILLGIFVLLAALLFFSIKAKSGGAAFDATPKPPSSVTVLSWQTEKTKTDLQRSAVTLGQGEKLATVLHLRLTDPNGCIEVTKDHIQHASLALYYGETMSSETCNATSGQDYVSCYVVDDVFSALSPVTSTKGVSPDCTDAYDTDVTYEMTLDLPHMMHESSGKGKENKWFMTMDLTDASGQQAMVDVTGGTLEVSPTNYLAFETESGLRAETGIPFGNRGLGTTGTASSPIMLKNLGNIPLEFTIDASPMECEDDTSIPVYDPENEAVGIRIGGIDLGYEDMLALKKKSSIFPSGFTHEEPLAVQLLPETAGYYINAQASVPTESLYFGLGVPKKGVKGTCSGSVVVTSIPTK